MPRLVCRSADVWSCEDSLVSSPEATPERFKKRRWRSEVSSSAGYSIRLQGRNTLVYRDAEGEIDVFFEPMAGSGVTVAVSAASIAETRDRSRADVMDNIARAFLYAGWTLIPD
jgi:hypothetical protein